MTELFNQPNLLECDPVDSLFEKLPELMRPEAVASTLGVSVKTIYDWHYRQKQKKVPQYLFLKMNRLLFLRTAILKKWIVSQNSSLA